MNLLTTTSGRYVAFTVLYLCEGAPIGFIWFAIPTLLRSEEVARDRIGGLVALLVLPWALKFLWAPLVDAWRGPRFGYRAWIGGAQWLMGLALLPLVVLDPVTQFAWWSGLLWIHALAASTQDVAIDALAIRCTPRAEHGRLNGCMQTGMLVGRGVFGGGAIWLASSFGSEVVILLLVGSIWAGTAVLACLREPDEATLHRSTKAGFRRFATHMQEALRHGRMWWGLLFALISAAAFEVAGVLAGPLLVDRHVPKDSIGQFFLIVPVTVPLAGVLVGGMMSDRWGRGRTVAMFLVGFVLMVAGLALTAGTETSSGAQVMAWLAGMYLFIGMFTAASYALYMDLTDPDLGGTQYSMFMSATNACESWSAKVGGVWAQAHGYPTAFALMCGVSLLSLPVLWRLAGRR